MPARSKRLRRGRRSEVSSFSGGAPHAAVFKSLLRTLTIVGGKGGVGKTTVSCALALAAVGDSERTSHVLLVSTDPAPSIGDAFGIVDSAWARNAPEALPELSALEVWQMDATTAFDSVRDRYKDRIDELFDAFTGRGIDASRDRAILRDLLALAPPGIDELYALAALGEILEEKRYSCIVVDPAPTGHLLRLLEMPAIALDWTHRLMRLILKYREVAPLGDAAQELVNFSRRTRALDQLLHDPARAGIVLVSLNEPIVRAESERLTKELRNAGVALLGIVWNRLQSGAEPASSDALPRHSIFAQESASPLVGRAAIADWSRRWQQRD